MYLLYVDIEIDINKKMLHKRITLSAFGRTMFTLNRVGPHFLCHLGYSVLWCLFAYLKLFFVVVTSQLMHEDTKHN
jgi:hypothetical protein